MTPCPLCAPEADHHYIGPREGCPACRGAGEVTADLLIAQYLQALDASERANRRQHAMEFEEWEDIARSHHRALEAVATAEGFTR